MDRSRRPWSRRDEKRGSRDELDEVESIVANKKRELGELKKDADRLRADRDKLRAELHRKSAALVHMEQQSRDASRDTSERLTKRFEVALDNAFAEVLGAPAAGHGPVAKADEEGEESEHSEEAAVDAGVALEQDDTPTAQAVPLPLVAGPGDAAPGPDKQDAPPSDAVAYTGFAVQQQTVLCGQ